MNDKYKKAFENWELDVEWSTAFTSHRLAAVDAWQAACEYMQAELAHHIFKIEAENANLVKKISYSLSIMKDNHWDAEESEIEYQVYKILENALNEKL